MFANARMYSIDGASAAHWRALLEWVIAQANVRVELLEFPAPRPLSALWQRDDAACVFMCGYPLARASPRSVPIAAPVPSPPCFGDRPVYWTDIVVDRDAPWQTIDDVLGKRLAHTVEHSQSGYQAVRRFLADRVERHGARLFDATIGPLVTPRDVVRAVLDGSADAGPLDSYAHALLRRHDAGLAARLRTIARTEPTPIPPLVAAPHTAPDVITALREALLRVGDAPDLAATRDALCLTRFESVDAAGYDVLVHRAREADTLGYPRLQ